MGDKEYLLVEDHNESLPQGCLDHCVYYTGGDTANKVCFGAGNLTSTCLQAGGEECKAAVDLVVVPPQYNESMFLCCLYKYLHIYHVI